MELLIKNARIIDASSNFVGDIYIENGIIKELGHNISKNCEALDVENNIIMPAFIDLHSHFRDPGLTYKEDLESGSKAAVKGGYTFVNLMGNTKPVCSDMETVNYVIDKAKKIGLVDVHQMVSITKNFDGVTINHLDALGDAVKSISDDGKGVLSNKVMFDAMVKAKNKGLIIMSHAEDEEITPISTRLSENIITVRDIELSKFTACHLHLCHVSTKEAMKAVIEAKKEGYNVTCEVTPHHIALTKEVDYKVNPPLRNEEDVEFLINAIKDGFVDAIGTDHAPHSKEDKENGAAGISGIETAFSICYTKLVKEGHITLSELSRIMSKIPGEIMNVNKGKIQIGFDGDLVLVDINKKYKINVQEFASKGKNTPLDETEWYGEVLKTFKGGIEVFTL